VISYGTWTLFAKEVRRFARVPGQTLLAPVITTVLYFVVFGWSLGGRLREIEGVPYARFIVPGLVALGVVTNAYSNTASSLFVMKLQGTVVDLLVSPLTYGQVLSAFVAAAVVRGLLVGGVTFCVAGLFAGFEVAHPLVALALVLLAAVLFGTLGLVTAIWASSFEQVNFVPTFFITPLTFLGGVFYSLDMLPPAFRRATLANPIFYMVDGVRFGILGFSDAPPWAGASILAALAALAVAAAYGLLRSGYKLRG
jgi:ABC-2 type transport system permease protein